MTLAKYKINDKISGFTTKGNDIKIEYIKNV